MNVILIETAFERLELPLNHPVTRHLIEVLRKREGDFFDAGVVNGPLGRGCLEVVSPAKIELSFVWGSPAPPPDPLILLQGLPRPQAAKAILQECATLGFSKLIFFESEGGEAGYRQSRLWATPSWRDCLLAGCAQAYATWLPEVVHYSSLEDALEQVPISGMRLALDNYEARLSLQDGLRDELDTPSRVEVCADPVYLALGAERGWSAREREQLREARFRLVHLGWRPFRILTAITLAYSQIAVSRHWQQRPFVPAMRFGGVGSSSPPA